MRVGTHDFYEDMADLLDKLGVPYLIAVGDGSRTIFYTNARNYENGIAILQKSIPEYLERLKEQDDDKSE